MEQVVSVSSPILWQCLHVAKSMTDFKNISYRVTKDMSGNELLIFYRNQVMRVFGPPVEPISLTLDSAGKCLLSIPFRPVQRVPITRAKAGQLELSALQTLLHMVAGKGFCFCPGIPDKILAGRACGKFITSHRAPFKRFNAVGCPVYFKIPQVKGLDDLKESQLPIRTLCPHCRQVAKWAQTQPISRNHTPIPQVVNAALQKLDENKNEFQGQKSVIPQSVGLEVVDVNSKKGGKSSVLDQPKSRQNSNASQQNADTKINVVGLGSNNGSRNKKGMNSEKLQAVSESLRQILRQRTLMNKERNDAIAKAKTGVRQNKSDNSLASYSPRSRSPKGEKPGKNVCRICHKKFSSNLRLSKHVQRHEGNKPHLSQVMRRKLGRQNQAVLLNRVFRMSDRQSPLSVNGRKREINVINSQSLVRMLKSIDEYLSDRKYKKERIDGVNNAPEKKFKKGKRKLEEQKLAPQPHLESAQSRPCLRRSGSGLAAVQTLLSAAELADIDSTSNSGTLITVNKFSVQNGLPDVSSNVELTVRDNESPSQAKKARTSKRLATKRANKKSKSGDEAEGEISSFQSGCAPSSDEAIMLTNLDLLSTVSLQAEMRDNQASPRHQLLSFAGNPDSKMHNVSSGKTEISMLPKSEVPNAVPGADNLTQPPIQPQTIRRPGSRIIIQNPNPVTVTNDIWNRRFRQVHSAPSTLNSLQTNVQSSSPHSTSAPMNQLPLSTPITPAQVQKVKLQNDVKTPDTQVIDFLLNEDVLGCSCEAMDLSKPKLSPASVESETGDKSASASQDSSDVLRHFLTINPVTRLSRPLVGLDSAPSKESLVSSKEADNSLQARMFASAKNYKLDSSKQGGQVQAVVASPATSSSGQNKGKEKAQAANEKSEIQCGYKWSGSGGLVKERTQLVRELVPSGIMANIMNVPVSNTGLLKMNDSILSPLRNVDISKLKESPIQKQLEAPQLNMTASNSLPSLNQNSSRIPIIGMNPIEISVRPKTPQYVLNLSKNRKNQDGQQKSISSPHVVSKPVLSSKLSPITIASTVPHVTLSRKPSNISYQAGVFKKSLLNSPTPIILSPSISSRKQPILAKANPTVNNADKSNDNYLSKTSLLTLPPNTRLTSPALTSPSLSAPNSSLATILRQSPKHIMTPTLTKPPSVSFSITGPSNHAPAISSIANMAKKIIAAPEVKVEPSEVFETSCPTAAMSTIIPSSLKGSLKTEVENNDAFSKDRDLSTPPDLVVDIDKAMVLPVQRGGKIKKKSSKSPKGKVSVVSGSLKCEFCSHIFESGSDPVRHVCPQS